MKNVASSRATLSAGIDTGLFVCFCLFLTILFLEIFLPSSWFSPQIVSAVIRTVEDIVDC